MARTIDITINAEPTAKGRPVFAVVCGHPRAITPQKTRVYERLINVSARAQINRLGLKCPAFAPKTPVRVDITFALKFPLSYSKKRKEAVLSGTDIVSRYKVTRPDLDNYVKAVLDGLNNVLYPDDGQISEMSTRKIYDTTDYVKMEITEIC